MRKALLQEKRELKEKGPNMSNDTRIALSSLHGSCKSKADFGHQDAIRIRRATLPRNDGSKSQQAAAAGTDQTLLPCCSISHGQELCRPCPSDRASFLPVLRRAIQEVFTLPVHVMVGQILYEFLHCPRRNHLSDGNQNWISESYSSIATDSCQYIQLAFASSCGAIDYRTNQARS